MFQKLFDKIDEFVENFKNINMVSDLQKITLEVLNIIKQALTGNLSPDMEENEKIFDELMGIPGLWKKIGEKAKKAMKEKEELLKFLLYVSAIMNEFQNRLRQKEREERKNKKLDRIIKKYMKYIQEIFENKNLDEYTRQKTIRDLKKSMERELESFNLEH